MNLADWLRLGIILKPYPYTFYAFGSRVNGKPTIASDLDLAVLEILPINDKMNMQESFDKSNLPFLVDLVELPTCSSDFQQAVQPMLLPLVWH
jgi:hypothetical protein